MLVLPKLGGQWVLQAGQVNPLWHQGLAWAAMQGFTCHAELKTWHSVTGKAVRLTQDTKFRTRGLSTSVVLAWSFPWTEKILSWLCWSWHHLPPTALNSCHCGRMPSINWADMDKQMQCSARNSAEVMIVCPASLWKYFWKCFLQFPR